MMHLLLARRFAPATIILGALFAWSATAAAQTPAPERNIADKDFFVQCLDGATPTTENVPAVDISGLDEIPEDLEIMDTNPYWDEVVIDFRDDLPKERILAFTESMGLDAGLNSEFSRDSNLFVAPVEEGAVPYVKDCLRATAPEGKILHIEENFEYRVPDSWRVSVDDVDEPSVKDFVPDDPLYQYQWNFKQIGAERAWESATGTNVTVAVIDTGVTVESNSNRGIKVGQDMEDVATVGGYDFVDDTDFVYDGHGHGTHVAGTIAQSTNNSYGVAGLAYDAQIMPLRVLNDQGFGSVSDIADAVRFAADNGADVINMSLGGPLPSWVLKRAVDYAHDKGTLVVSAAGNSGKRSPSYPAAYKNSMAIAATQYDQHTTFYSQWGEYVDIAAPGGNTRVDQNGDGRPDGIMQETHPRGGKTDQHEFALYMGTSMASPHVAAAAAMVISAGASGPEQVKQVLLDTADDSMREHYDDREFSERYGTGLLQVDGAVEQALALQQPDDRAARCAFLNGVDFEEHKSGDEAAFSLIDLTRLGGALVLVLLTLFGLRRRQRFDLSKKESAMLLGATGAVAGGLMLFVPPLLASFLLPLGAYALLAGRRSGRIIAGAIALGVAAFCFSEVFLLNAEAAWLPGIGGVLDRAFLLANGLLSLAIGYLGLKPRE